MTKKIQILDGTEVEYVEVHDEPIHRYQFSNDYVYIYIVGFRYSFHELITAVDVFQGPRSCLPRFG